MEGGELRVAPSCDSRDQSPYLRLHQRLSKILETIRQRQNIRGPSSGRDEAIAKEFSFREIYSFTRSSLSCFPFSLPLLASSSSPLLLDGSSLSVWLIIRPADRTTIRFRQKEPPFFHLLVIQLVAVQFILDQIFLLNRFTVCL